MRSLVMGVLNVTPDSFYDGGRYLDHDAAIAHGLEMVKDGADIVDVGGESSRPGADPVPEHEELRRVLPVVEVLAPHVRVSIDTMKPAVAEAACRSGATLVNDLANTSTDVAAAMGVGLIVMHMQGTPKTMQDNPHYDDVVGEVMSELDKRVQLARRVGVKEVYVDPGIGFGKTLEHNLALLRALPEFVAAAEPVLVGTSRKSFIGSISTSLDPLGPEDRFEGSLATAVWAMAAGVAVVRVHDVKATVAAARLIGDRDGEPTDAELRRAASR